METIKTTSLFGVFSNPQRLSIIKTIATGPISVTEIANKPNLTTKMIHYHGSPFGGRRDDVPVFFNSRHALIPYPRPDDIGTIADVCQSFVLDNGAFTIWKQGGQMDYPGYLEFVEKWHKHPAFDWAIIPDVIEGSEAENDRFLEMWPGNFKGVPVYHNYMPISRLKKLADKYECVALGSSGIYSSVGNKKWWLRMGEMMNSICDGSGRPACKLHGLRMLDPAIFQRIPLSSADSTNAAQNNCQLSRFGMYTPPTASQRAAVIADRIEAYSSAPVWTIQPEQEELNFLLSA